MIKNLKVSVIIPIYNTEQYLREAVDSVIHQDIGFEDNVQIILINDGSQDNSEEICLEYAGMYPRNIQYIYQDNAGVATARNKALQHVTGSYVLFLDSDDMLGDDVLSKTYTMLEENRQIDVAAVRVKLFEAKDEYHVLDYKYKGDEDRVIDLLEDYDHIQNSCSNTLIRYSSLESKKFNEKLKYSEDLTLMCEILLESNKLGTVPSATYYYRKREDQSSAIDTRKKDAQWYFNTPRYCYIHLFDLSKKKYGKVLPYIQWSVMHDLQWRINADPELMMNTLSKEEQIQYRQILFDLINEIDDEIIIKQRFFSYYFKTYCLSKKYNKSVDETRRDLLLSNEYLTFDGFPLWNMYKRSGFCIDTISMEQGKLKICGIANDFIPKDMYELFLITDMGERIKIDFDDDLHIDKRAFNGDAVKKKHNFAVSVSMENTKAIRFEVIYKKQFRFTTRIRYEDTVEKDGISKESVLGNKILKTKAYEIQIQDYYFLDVLKKRMRRRWKS